MKRCVVLSSGGMDSTVALAIAREENEVYPLHVNYRHRTEKREFACFREIISYYGIKNYLSVDIDYLRQIGTSSLTDSRIGVEVGAPKPGEVPSSYVPFRNSNLLSIAVSYSEAIGAESVFIGAVEDDSSGYPDCTREFIEAFNEVIRKGSKAGSRIKIIAPLINMSKDDIVKKGLVLKVPFHLTWSCYTSNEKACGKCQSCFLRLKGFRGAGAEDPIEYER